MSTLTPDPQPHDPSFATFTDDADSPYAPRVIACEATLIPGASPDETGYRVEGQHYCLVRMSRPRDAAASMYGHLAIAFAVDAEGRPMLRASGRPIEASFTAAVGKELLVVDAATKSAALRQQAIQGVLRELLIEIAVERANFEVGI